MELDQNQELDNAAVRSALILMEVDQNQEVDNACSNNGDDNVIQPAVGMSFENGQEYADFCHLYAFRSGFQFFTRTGEFLDEFKGIGKARRKSGEEPQYHMMKRLRLVCARGGDSKPEHPSKSQVIGCKAYIDARMKEGRMTITIMELDHNHPMEAADSPFMIKYKYMSAYHERRNRPIAAADDGGMAVAVAIDANVKSLKSSLNERDDKVKSLESKLKERDGRIKELLEKSEALERQNNRLKVGFQAMMAMEENRKKSEEEKNLELIQKIQVLEREKKQMVAEVSKLNKKNGDETGGNNKAVEAEKKRCLQLEEVMRKLEIDLKAAERKITEGDEAVVKLRVIEAKVESLKSLLEERDDRIKTLWVKNEALDREYSRLEMDFKAMEGSKKKLEEKNLELIRVLEREKEQMLAEIPNGMESDRGAILAKKIVELDGQCGQLKEDIINLKEEVVEVKGKEEKTKDKYLKVKEKYAEMKGKLDSEKKMWKEEEKRIREKCRQLEVEKKKLEIDLKSLTSSLEERDVRITEFKAKTAMEANKKSLEEEKNLEMIQNIRVLEREEQMLEEVSKMNEENNDEAERDSEAVEVEMKRCLQLEGKRELEINLKEAASKKQRH